LFVSGAAVAWSSAERAWVCPATGPETVRSCSVGPDRVQRGRASPQGQCSSVRGVRLPWWSCGRKPGAMAAMC